MLYKKTRTKIKTIVLKRNQGRVFPTMMNIFGSIDFQNIFDAKLEIAHFLEQNSIKNS